MAFAQGSRSSLSYGVESTFGVAATGTYGGLPIKTHSLDLSKDRLQGMDIYSDRMPRVSRHGNRQTAGTIEVDLRKGNYDDFLESGMMSSFDSSDVMTVGTTPKFLTIEDALNDITQFRLFTGMTVSSTSFSIAPNQMVNTVFTMVGANMTVSGTGKTTSAAVINDPFDSYSASMYEGGVGSGDVISIISSIDFSITNSFAPTFVVGSDTTPQLEFGRSIIEGTITAYFEDLSLLNKFLNETESEIEINVDAPAGTDTYTFWFPRIKYNGGNIPLANEQSRLVTLPFEALYDTTATTQLKLTRTS